MNSATQTANKGISEDMVIIPQLKGLLIVKNTKSLFVSVIIHRISWSNELNLMIIKEVRHE